MFTPTVDTDKCTGCGECVEVCPVEVFELEDEKSNPVNAEAPRFSGCEGALSTWSAPGIRRMGIGRPTWPSPWPGAWAVPRGPSGRRSRPRLARDTPVWSR